MSTVDPNWWTSATYEGQSMPEILAAHEFGKAFAFLRARGWSVGAISGRTGIDEYRIWEYIKGNRQIEKHKLIERIADGLEIDRRLCRIADFSSDDPPVDLAGSAVEDGAGELRDLLSQANSLDHEGLVLLAEHTNHIRTVDRGFCAHASDSQIRGHLETLQAMRSFTLLPANRQRLADLFRDAAALAGWLSTWEM